MTTYHRGEGTQKERDGREDATSHVPPGTPGHQDENDNTENSNKPSTNSVLGLKERLGTFKDDGVNLLEACRLFRVLAASSREGLRLATAGRRDNGNALDHCKLKVGPYDADGTRGEDDYTSRLWEHGGMRRRE